MKIVKSVHAYATEKKVRFMMYPNYRSSLADTEEAVALIKVFGSPPNMNISFHVCHILKAGNHDCLGQVFLQTKNYAGLVFISGADSVVATPLYEIPHDWSNQYSHLKAVN